MKTYEAYVTGTTSRRVTISALNQKAAEVEARREFTALVAGESDVEVISIKELEGEL